MKHLLVLVSSVILVASGSAASAQESRPVPDVPVVITSGEADVKRAPDRAWVTIRAESRAQDPKEAQRANADAMNAVTAKLKGMNLGADAIRTVSYELQPEFDYNEGRQRLRGYVARNTIEVRVDEISRLGDVLGVAVVSGATSVGGLRWDLKNREAAEREALRMAVNDARARAEAAAAGAGLRIDRIIRIEENRTPVGIPRPMAAMGDARQMAMSADAPPPITPGTIDIHAQVTLTAEIR